MGLHTEKPGIKTTGVANGAITKRRFIDYTDAVVSSIGALAKGVSGESDQDTGVSFEITISGTALVEAGEALEAGEQITSNALGKAIKATNGHYINGVVMRDQATTGQLVEVKLMNGAMISTAATTTTSTTTTTTTTTTSTTTTTTSEE